MTSRSRTGFKATLMRMNFPFSPMKATLEISLYALHDDYEISVINFIERIKSSYDVRVDVNGLSTQIFSDYDTLMTIIDKECRHVLEQNPSVFVMKLARGELTRDKLPSELK